MKKIVNGFWANATRKHLKEFVDYSDNADIFRTILALDFKGKMTN